MKKEVAVFLVLLRELQKIDPEFPLQYAICFSEIALDEGQSLTALSTKTGMPLSTVSRIVGALSRQRQKGTPYGLVRVAVSPQERRKKELYLTTRGRAIMQDISIIIGNNADQRLRA
ncbi:MAG: helix-turn-helix domain-containing protein [Rhodospirillales bacterium]|nr:helix-turn-helix domain-containing protein [Rhodospirillales bacterium]MCB9995169.1 helix-turn-helix domain-containing protein [Rhodospirillales bacterium]